MPQILCHHLEHLQKLTPFFKDWSQIFYTQEFALQDVPFPVGEDFVFITGKVDAVRNHPKRGLEVVDYKLSHGNNLEQDLLQIAIYSQLLRITKSNITFHGLLEYYEPEVHETPVTQEVLSAIFRDKVEPVFKELLQRAERQKSHPVPDTPAQSEIPKPDAAQDESFFWQKRSEPALPHSI